MASVTQLGKSLYKNDLQEAVRTCEALRKDTEDPQDIKLSEYVKARWGVSMEAFYDDLGINPTIDTVENIINLPDPSVRWLIPEIFRDALRLGLRKAPIYPEIIAAEQTVKGLQLIQPSWNMSDAAPRYIGVAETITTGDVSYGQKTVHLRKIGRAIKIPYEVRNFVSVNILSIFLQDYGIKMGQAMDTLLINTLINGEQADGSESAPVIGIVDTTGGLVYRDLIKPFVRGGRLGRQYGVMIAGENTAITLLDLPEYKYRLASGPQYANLDIKTPIPNKASCYVHSAVPASQIILVDPAATIIKYNAQPLLVESEKIISNQTELTTATLITGFGIIFRDGRLIVDQSLAFSGNGFPSYMDPSTQEIVNITK